MAFTTDGMFYLSQKDYAPTMDTLGGAARGMLGLQNKEEAVNTILEGADYSTPEGRRAALDQIRSIDPDRWATLNKQNQDYETKELDIKAKYGEPVNKQAWTKTEVPAITSKWALDNLAFYDLSGAIEALGHQPTTDTDITNILVWLAKNDDDLPSGKAGMLKTSYTSMLKSKKADYLLLNKYNPQGSSKDEQNRDLNSIKGRGERTAAPVTAEQTATTATTAPVQQYRIERRMGKDVKVPYTPAPVYDVQRKLQEQEQEVLSNMPGMY